MIQWVLPPRTKVFLVPQTNPSKYQKHDISIGIECTLEYDFIFGWCSDLLDKRNNPMGCAEYNCYAEFRYNEETFIVYFNKADIKEMDI